MGKRFLFPPKAFTMPAIAQPKVNIPPIAERKAPNPPVNKANAHSATLARKSEMA